MKYFYGVISKNQVDSIIEYSLKHSNVETTFIPSRRQIEYCGGYVNNWTTKDFSEYVKRQNPNINLERDHAGPGQGFNDDDGFESLKEDCKYFDIIHIDPWKKFPALDDGIKWTIDMIKFCYNLNQNIIYEIGTEEDIRPFTICELEDIIISIKHGIDEEIFRKIKYCVVQCGNSLCNGKNSGIFDKSRLSEMITLVNKYNLISKEHNGDWISTEIIKQKKLTGLECINIAPEFGTIESKVILDSIKTNTSHYEKIYDLCYKSEKWKKWVNSDFDFEKQKDELILITCHYIYNIDVFKEIKKCYNGIDLKIKNIITNKLSLLNFIYEIREKCIFCYSHDIKTILEEEYLSSLSLGMTTKDQESYFMPYNVQICNECNSLQNKYIGDLSIIYGKNHVDDYGLIKSNKHELFCKFICENKNINGIIEIGSCNGVLANKILEKNDVEYNIIEPSFIGDKTGLNIIEDYFENVDLINIKANALIMSDVFEHFYNPIDILNKILKSENINYVYLSHPDFDYSIKNLMFTNLNCEHTFLIEHQFLFNLFKKYGFSLSKKYDYENYSLFLEFTRNDNIIHSTKDKIINYNLFNNIKNYFDKINGIVNKINDYMNTNLNKKIYIWPTSVHSVTLFTMGLYYKKLAGILDNSPNKIGKYNYGYNLLCSSLDGLLKSNEDNVTILISGAGNYIKELDLTNTKIEIIFINEL